MGTGWRRAFCTTIQRNHNRPAPESESSCSSPKTTTTGSKIGFQSSSSSNPSTPRLRCKTSTTPTSKNSNPSSPRSPFSLFRTGAFRSSFKSNCGICSQSVKTGQGMAIFTAECSHEFHFPCISSHVKSSGTGTGTGTSLICPVCQANWKEVPLLQLIRNKQEEQPNNNKDDSCSLSSPKIKQLRSYDDDEPLLSPRTGFNPIPEELDDDDQEIHEFQGFFVDPNLSSSSSSGLITTKKSTTIDVRVESDSSTASTALISVGRRHQTYALVVKVKAPAQTRRSSRAPIDLVTVLDVSCNMTRAKLQMLKRAMRLVISSLSTSDRLSIVAFSGSPKRLFPLQRMTSNGQRLARRIIDRLVCVQGSSCVGDALKKATKVLEDRRERNPVASIMLLSDGNESSATNADSNHNKQRRAATTSSTRFAHLEIPAADSRQQDDVFAKCVGGLLSVVVQDLRLQLSLGFSHSQSPSSILPEISAVYSWNGGRPKLLGSGGQGRMGDLYAEEERELLVEFRVPDDATSFIGTHQKMMMSVHFRYKDPANPNQDITKDHTVLIPNFLREPVPESNTQRLRNLFVATRAISESHRLVEMNDLSNAFHLLSSARAMLMQWSSTDDEYVHALEVELGDLHLRRQYHIQLQQKQQQTQGRRRSSLARSSSSNGRESPITGTAFVDEDGEPLTPTSAWRAAERLAKLAIMRKSLNRSNSELHGFENARF